MDNRQRRPQLLSLTSPWKTQDMSSVIYLAESQESKSLIASSCKFGRTCE